MQIRAGIEHIKRVLRPSLSDAVLAPAVFILATVFALVYLMSWVANLGQSDTWIFEHAAMVATGHGLKSAGQADIQGFHDFLEQRAPSFPAKILRDSDIESDPNPFARRHCYLIWSIGIAWWIVGLSWGAVKALLAVFFGLSALSAYGIFRMGMNRLFSLAALVLFVTAPPFLQMMPFVRDFCKTPLILGVVFLVGLLVSKSLSALSYLVVSALLGMLLGVGLGFRQDLMILVPLAGATVVFARNGAPRRPLALNPAGLVLFGAVFVLCAWPILSTMYTTGGTTSHYLIQGLSKYSEEELDIGPSSIDPLPTDRDQYVFALQNVHFLRSHGHCTRSTDTPPLPSALPEEPRYTFGASTYVAGREWFEEMMRLFPSDFAVRVLASVIQVVRGSEMMAGVSPYPGFFCHEGYRRFEQALAAHLKTFGVLYAVVALLLIGARNPGMALVTLGILLYVCGYPSLLFRTRHVFPLGFVALWFPGFVLDKVLLYAARLAKRHVASRSDEKPEYSVGMKSVVYRMLVSAGISLAGLVVPLCLLHLYQATQLSALLTQYNAAEMEPVPVEFVDTANNRVLVKPKTPLPGLGETDSNAPWRPKWEYLALDMAPACGNTEIWISYDPSAPLADFSHVATAPPGMKDHAGGIKYFFAVYEVPVFDANTGRGRFLGVGVPRERVQCIKGLYRVRDTRPLPFLLDLWLPDNPSRFEYCKSLPPFFR